MQRRRLRPAIGDGDANQQIVRIRLGIFCRHVPVKASVEDTGVGQFIFQIVPPAAAILGHELPVRELGLRVFIQSLQVTVRRRGVEVKIGLLHIFPVISLPVRQPEQSLFQNGVAAIPQGKGKAQPALAIGDAEQPVLAPTVRPAAGVVVGEVGPCVPVRRIVLADGAPLPLGQIRPPPFPVPFAATVFGQADRFRVRGLFRGRGGRRRDVGHGGLGERDVTARGRTKSDRHR